MAANRVSHSLLDPYLTTPFRKYYPALNLPKRLPPEAIVLMGHAAGIAAALCMAVTPTIPWLGILSALFVVAHHLCDVFDGQHARATGQCRNGGELLDHFLDPLSIAYLVLGWGFAVGHPLWALPGALIVMATAVLTNLKAKLGGTFELPALGPTEFKTFMTFLPLVAAAGYTFAPTVIVPVLGYSLLSLTAAAALRLPFEIVSAVRSVNRSSQEADTTEWVNV